MRPHRRTRAPRLAAAALLAAALPALAPAQPRAAAPAPLRVIRTTPAPDAGPLARVSVTFDRPVAGALDRAAADPAALLRVEPAVPGRVEWRDPSTIRLTPAAPLVPGRRYAVTVGAGVQALDGSRLDAPYRFTFRASGPALLAASALTPTGESEWQHLGPRPRFQLVYGAPADLAALAAGAYLELRATCGGARVVRLRAAEQRRVRADDRGDLREAGGWDRDRAADSLRRVVTLTPDTPLPRGCAGELVAPRELAPGSTKGYARHAFATYGDLRLARVRCAGGGAGGAGDRYCPTGPVTVEFTTPVRGAEVNRRLRLVPEVPFELRDDGTASTTWTLEAPLAPRTAYAVVADTALRDAFGQPLRGNPAAGVRTTGHAPEVAYPFGRRLVERVGFRTLAVRHVNVDTLVATVAPVPAALEALVLGRDDDGGEDGGDGARDSVWTRVFRGAAVRRVAVRAGPDRPTVTGLVLAPPAGPDAPGLYAVRVGGRAAPGVPALPAPNPAKPNANAAEVPAGPTALVQVTDLGVHARVGVTEGWVWVTGVSDGAARAGAMVALFDARGRQLAAARTDARGLAHLTGWGAPARPAAGGEDDDDGPNGFEGYVRITLGDDRAYAAVDAYDPDLSPWQFNVARAWGDERAPVAGAVFTERGIYRPGERVVAKAVVRDGALGALRAPAPGDSVQWRFHDRDEGMLLEASAPLSAFGTADRAVDLPRAARPGEYALDVRVRRQGRWRTVARTQYRVAEYRPPEFLVDLDGVRAGRVPGDTFGATVQARYLFGARMGRAALAWTARQSPLPAWELAIPGTDGWSLGAGGPEADGDDGPDGEALRSPAVFASGADTLDARGERALAVRLPARPDGRPARVTLQATVTDVNRQQVAASTTALVHPADFYVAARAEGKEYFWRAGTPVRVQVVAVRPDGARVPGVQVRGVVVRREWHRVRRVRGGVAELVGEWVADTVARCAVVTAAEPDVCGFTPRAAGEYTVRFEAADGRGRRARTSFRRWAAGPDFVPWNDESQFRMDVIPDRERYAVGDTASVLLAVPFTDAEAWVTVEREGVFEQRRVRLAAGATTLRFPVTEAYAPNAFVSVLVARGRTAKPGPRDDPGRPTLRVGYAELRVTPEVKRLQVAVRPERQEYGPGDTARVRLAVRDAGGAGRRAEVTLWAVDEGVLALTGYQTPDPLDLVYQARGVGLRLASNMTGVAPQVPDGDKGQRAPGGGGGADGAEVLRSRFQTTAFFLGAVVTDDAGNATAAARLPDNLTTFRVMAVAVTDGDRYGRGQASLLVTRPLLARPALPRFVRPGDVFAAGAVVNRRDGAAAGVRVRAAATGAVLGGDAERRVALGAGRGAELRFPFRAPASGDGGDSVGFRFDVSDDAGHRDAVRVALAVRPDRRPRMRTFAGVVRDSAAVEIPVGAGVDLARSRLMLHVGGSPLAAVRGAAAALRVYPYACTEQVVSAALPALALLRAEREAGGLAEVARAVDVLSRRQRADGGIGYWSASDWTTPWLSAYAGLALLDARDVGAAVDSRVLARLAAYLTGQLRGTANAPTVAGSGAALTPVAAWTDRREGRLRERVAAADFLSRFGRADVAAENDLLRGAAQLALEDRARLAVLFARRGDVATARRLLAPSWARVRVEGRRAVLPDTAADAFYFESRLRPAGALLAATLAVEPDHPLVGPLVEALVDQGRAARTRWAWNTQDYASTVAALAAYERRRREGGERAVRVRAGGRVLLDTRQAGAAGDSGVALAALLPRGGDGGRAVRLTVDAAPGAGSVYYWLTVAEVPAQAAASPEDAGITVERWYERYDGTGGGAITTAAAGDLVRVRLRVRVAATRHLVVLDDALPAGLEAVDLSLRTAARPPGPGARRGAADDAERTEQEDQPRWAFGSWDGGWWSPFDHRELRDDRVVYAAAVLWPGTYTATYLARATTPGTFVRPPARAEEMYNPAVFGESDGGTFVVTGRP